MADGSKAAKRESGDRRQEILDAATAIFRERGYEATTIQAVADAVGILKGSLYYYFDSKEDLLFEVINDVHEGGLRNLEAGTRAEGDALQRIRLFVESHITYNAKRVEGITVFFQDFRSLSSARRNRIVEERDLYDKRLRQLITEGQKQGIIRPDIDPKLAAFSILGSINWIYQWYRPDGPLPIAHIASVFAELAVRSVRSSDGEGGSDSS